MRLSTAARTTADRPPTCSARKRWALPDFADNMPDTYMQITVTNYFNVACGTCAPGYFDVNNYQLSDDYSMTKGKHQIGFGVDWPQGAVQFAE